MIMGLINQKDACVRDKDANVRDEDVYLSLYIYLSIYIYTKGRVFSADIK